MTGEVVDTDGANWGRTIATLPNEGLIGHVTHEFGHTMTLRHAPGCWPGHVDRSTDPSYPYSTGITGVWGYDFRDGGTLVRPQHPEVMAFCGGYSGGWISDYHFTKALRHRLRVEVDDGTAAAAASVPSLLLWGGVDETGAPFLEPALVVDAPPVRPEWANTLASITLSGPGGSFTLDGETDRPIVILRDRFTGQVRGILRDLSAATLVARDTAAGSAGTGLEVLFSRGIPHATAWRR